MWLGVNNSVWEIAGIPIDKALKEIDKFGLLYVDVAAFGSANPLNLSSGQRQRISGRFCQLGLKVIQMIMLPRENIASSQRKEREKCLAYLKECAEFQAELGGKQLLLGFGAGNTTFELSRERAWAYSVEFLQDFCEWLQGVEMYLCLELEPTVYCMVNNTNTMVRMIEDVHMPNLCVNIDIGHLAITREGPEKLEKLKDKIIHIHISDNNGLAHANDIIGTGVCPVAAYVNKFAEIGIDQICQNYGEPAVAALELGDQGKKAVNPRDYVDQSLQFLEKVTPDLRRSP